MTRDEIKSIQTKINFLPEAGFGQNFLCDDSVIKKIIELVPNEPDAKILEIGPGLGSLTRPLGKKFSDFTVIEIDKRLAEFLSNDEEISARIICSDYLKLSPEEYGAKDYNYVVSNLPYYCMTPIIKKLATEVKKCNRMVLMTEEDALERIFAAPKTKQYGPLAILLNLYGDVKKEFSVPGHCFEPAPKTTSCILTIAKKDASTNLSSDFVAFVECCFSMRRKTLANNLKGFADIKGTGYEGKRAEELEPAEFLAIYNAIIS